MQYSTMMCVARLAPESARQLIFVGDIRQLCPQVDRLTGESSLIAVAGVLDGSVSGPEEYGAEPNANGKERSAHLRHQYRRTDGRIRGRSLRNLAEALAAATLTKVLLKVGMTRKDIVVITMYEAQRRLIIHALEQEDVGEVNVFSVDKAKGSEAELTILSLVRASDEVMDKSYLAHCI
uniref:DNA2/NAM7 helicase-like C-terminal domain-containing protein n=1 Tax=Plectus sambesii TaxID=2011161 RepID=A0A914WWJ1_9BILA